MAFLQISEPGQSPEPHQKEKDSVAFGGKQNIAYGIDLGTTHTLVARMIDGSPTTLQFTQTGHDILPSVVDVTADNIVVGNVNSGIHSVKRLLGRSLSEINRSGVHYHLSDKHDGLPWFNTAQGEKSPVEITSEILKAVKSAFNHEPSQANAGAVITVPAYFDDAMRQATKDAAQLAGIKVLRLLNEPTAAALAYGLDDDDAGLFLIYDLGGGTFDVTLLNRQKGVFEVKATGGDASLGGDDFDLLIAGWLKALWFISDEEYQLHQRELLLKARKLKEALSNRNEAHINWQGKHASLSKESFETLAKPLLRRTLTHCESVLKDAGVQVNELKGVVLVGGSTRMPMVSQGLLEAFDTTIFNEHDPDRVVALGAAIQANKLAGNRTDNDALLLDVVPLSLGLEVMGGLVEKVIHRNAPIPTHKAQQFTTFQDGQTAMDIHVLQGERELVEDCRSLARFRLTGIPPMVAGAAKIEVSFHIDADGILEVNATELTSRTVSNIEVKPAYGIEPSQMMQMIQEAFEHGAEDIKLREWRETCIDARSFLSHLSLAIAQDSELLSESSRLSIDQGIVALQNLIESGDCENKQKLKDAISEISMATEKFAADRMNKAVRQALSGKSIDALDTRS